MDSLDEVIHPSFSYVFISVDVNDEVTEGTFNGREGKFRELMRLHFNNQTLEKDETTNLKSQLDEQAKHQLTADQLNTAIGSSHTYQIVPLTLPTKANGFEAVNAYIDNIGRIKNLGTNARASRICSTDIRGDCFLSKTFDDEEVFKRVDFGKANYEEMLENPPTSSGRWNQAEAMAQIMNQNPNIGNSNNNNTETPEKKCWNCGRVETVGLAPTDAKTDTEGTQGPSDKVKDNSAAGVSLKLRRCTRCDKAWYCNTECQKADWRLHKRVCK